MNKIKIREILAKLYNEAFTYGVKGLSDEHVALGPISDEVIGKALAAILALGPRWVSVKERLPEKLVKILWVGDPNYSKACLRCVPPASPTRFGFWNGIKFHDLVSGIDLKPERVTHWQPLPEAPSAPEKEEREKD